MKTQKLFSLDLELVKRLQKEDNASLLVNDLLMIHYSNLKDEDSIIKEVKRKIQAKEDKAKNDRLTKEMYRKEKAMGFKHKDD